MLEKLTLVHSLEVTGQALGKDRLTLRNHLHDLLLRMAVHKAEVFLEFGIGRLEFKICRNVTAQPVLRSNKRRHHYRPCVRSIIKKFVQFNFCH